MAKTEQRRTAGSVRAAPNTDMLGRTTSLMDTGRELVLVTALNIEKRLLIGYLFRREEYPWLQTWEHYPEGKTLARGLEFRRNPTTCRAGNRSPWGQCSARRRIAGCRKVEDQLALSSLLYKVPEGMKKVDDVRLDGKTLIVEDKQAGVKLSLAASQGL